MSSVSAFPIERTLEFNDQQDPRELVLMTLEGHPPERKKKIILEARRADLITDADCAMFIDAYGLGAE